MKRYLKPALMILLTLLGLYILSVGPARWVCLKFKVFRNHPAFGRTAEAFYSPLNIIRHNSSADLTFEGYLNFWTPKEFKDKPAER
jgi:hypothetical protein